MCRHACRFGMAIGAGTTITMKFYVSQPTVVKYGFLYFEKDREMCSIISESRSVQDRVWHCSTATECWRISHKPDGEMCL